MAAASDERTFPQPTESLRQRPHVARCSLRRGIRVGCALVICAVLQVSPAAAAGGAADVAKLNAQRAANGIPAGIAHVAERSQWCDQHIAYMEANGGGLSHEEQPGHPGHTVGGQMAGANS